MSRSPAWSCDLTDAERGSHLLLTRKDIQLEVVACGCQEKGRIQGAQEACRGHSRWGQSCGDGYVSWGRHGKVPWAGPLNDRDLLSLAARGRQCEIKVSAGLVSSEGSRLGV